MKPNPFLYAVEVTRKFLLSWIIPGLIGSIPLIWLVSYSDGSLSRTVVLLVIVCFLSDLAMFTITSFYACYLMFIVTDKRQSSGVSSGV